MLDIWNPKTELAAGQPSLRQEAYFLVVTPSEKTPETYSNHAFAEIQERLSDTPYMTMLEAVQMAKKVINRLFCSVEIKPKYVMIPIVVGHQSL